MTNRQTGQATRAGAALTALLLCMLGTGPRAAASTKSDLAAARAKVAKLIDQVAAEAKVVAAFQSELSVIAGRIDAVQSKIATTEGDIAAKMAQIADANQRLSDLQDQLDHRAWVAYEGGPGTTIEVLLSSTSLSDLSDRLEIIDHAAKSDQDLIDHVRDLRAQLRERRLELQRREADLKSQQADLVAQQNDLASKLQQAQAAVEQLDRSKAEADALVKKLKTKLKKEEAARLAAEAAAAAAAANGGSHGGSNGGGGGGGTVSGHPFSVCPVDQPRGYSDGFGAPRYAGGYHPHAGNDLMSPLGTPIRATFSGTASVASNGLGGLAVFVTGSEGYTYNAHLSRFGQLGPVSAGTIVGYVGNSGDAAGGPTHDHFEWHPNVIPSNPWRSPYGYSVIGDAIDPFPYLNQVC